MLSRFDTIPEREGQTDGQTELLYRYVSIQYRNVRDRQTDRQNYYIDIARLHKKLLMQVLCGCLRHKQQS